MYSLLNSLDLLIDLALKMAQEEILKNTWNFIPVDETHFLRAKAIKFLNETSKKINKCWKHLVF